MNRYLTPLPGLLAAMLDGAINQALALDEGSLERLANLDGKCLALALDGLAIELYFEGKGSRLAVSIEPSKEPDTRIHGTPWALLAMSRPEWRSAQSGVGIEGDAGCAQALEQLLRRLDPDYEAFLATHLGPILGQQVAQILKQGQQQSQQLLAIGTEQLARYLREESGVLVKPDEMAEFADDVDELREAADRLEAYWRRQAKS